MVENRIRFLLLGSIIVMLCGVINAQSNHSITEEPSITEMMDVYARKFKSIEKVKAWRIQVAAMTDRREMEKEKVRFENIFYHLRLEWTHDDPYYILTIRDVAFQEKLNALHLLHKIKERYPSAILVLADVKPEELLHPSDY